MTKAWESSAQRGHEDVGVHEGRPWATPHVGEEDAAHVIMTKRQRGKLGGCGVQQPR